MRRLTSVLATFTFTLVLTFGVFATSTLAAEGRNNDNALLCQQGGWQLSAPSDSRENLFASQAECVTYGAHGGSIVYVGPKIALGATVGERFQAITGTGFTPASFYNVLWEVTDAGQVTSTGGYGVQADTDGSFTTGATAWKFCSFGARNLTVHVFQVDVLVYQEEMRLTCP